MKADHFLQQLDHARITAAIVEAERGTSGSVRVCVSQRQRDDALGAARRRFALLGMDKTAERNAVLIFFVPRTRKYALVGDAGIHAKCGGDEFWQEVAGEVMRPLLAAGQYTEAVVAAVGAVGRQLARHFPPRNGGGNELPDEVVTD